MLSSVATCCNIWQAEPMSNTTLPSTAIRRGLAEILIRVHHGEHIKITHYDRSASVMVPPEWYDRAVQALAAAEARD